MKSCPWVGVVADRRQLGNHYFHLVGEKYLTALLEAAGVQPLTLPALAGQQDAVDMLARLDGVFLTGSPSNVEPRHYAGTPSRQGTLHDPQRDLVALGLIPEVIKAGLPLLAVCRGFQEMNVALGGSLHQLVYEVPDYMVHEEDSTQALEQQYGPAHRVDFVAGGLLQKITALEAAMVNSLHSQAVDRLAPSLSAEAIAQDGLIEAFVVENAPGFTLGVQWHPEWQVMENPVSQSIFLAFGQACRQYAGAGTGPRQNESR